MIGTGEIATPSEGQDLPNHPVHDVTTVVDSDVHVLGHRTRPGDDRPACMDPGLVVVPDQVADTADGWAADGGVVAVMVVDVQPLGQGRSSLGF